MNDSKESRIPEERLTTGIRLLISLWAGVVVFALGLSWLLSYLETLAETMRLLISLVLIPLSALTTWLVAHLLGWRPINSS